MFYNLVELLARLFLHVLRYRLAFWSWAGEGFEPIFLRLERLQGAVESREFQAFRDFHAAVSTFNENRKDR